VERADASVAEVRQQGRAWGCLAAVCEELTKLPASRLIRHSRARSDPYGTQSLPASTHADRNRIASSR
jgi:hypothetical protein